MKTGVRSKYAYFQDELNYLRELGKEFAHRYPNAAGNLGREGGDPDVERLLEGFAFLASRIHERLDDQFGQVAEAFLQILWPEALRPVPSSVMVQFKPIRNRMRTDILIKKDAVLQSVEHPWGRHQFTTLRPLRVYPFELVEKPRIGVQDSYVLRFVFELLPGASFETMVLDYLPIHLQDDDNRFTYGWFLWLSQYIKDAWFLNDDGSRQARVNITTPVFDSGISSELVDSNELPGTGLLKQYLTLPQQLMTVHVENLCVLAELGITKRFELLIDFGELEPTPPMYQVQDDSFRLNCVPAVNTFAASARLTLDHTRSEYLLRPEEPDIAHAEIYSVKKVTGIEKGPRARKRHFQPFLTRSHDTVKSHVSGQYYRTRFADTHVDRDGQKLTGKDCFISFGAPHSPRIDEAIQTLSVDLICCHRGGAADLGLGELCAPTADVTSNSLTYENISRPSEYYPAESDPEYFWFMVNSFGTSRRTLASLNRLRSTLILHSKRFVSRHMGFKGILDRLKVYNVMPAITIESGTPVRILQVTLEFECDPDELPEHYFVGLIIGEFLRQMATINTRIRTDMRFRHDKSMSFHWPHRTGTCAII